MSSIEKVQSHFNTHKNFEDSQGIDVLSSLTKDDIISLSKHQKDITHAILEQFKKPETLLAFLHFPHTNTSKNSQECLKNKEKAVETIKKPPQEKIHIDPNKELNTEYYDKNALLKEYYNINIHNIHLYWRRKIDAIFLLYFTEHNYTPGTHTFIPQGKRKGKKGATSLYIHKNHIPHIQAFQPFVEVIESITTRTPS